MHFTIKFGNLGKAVTYEITSLGFFSLISFPIEQAFVCIHNYIYDLKLHIVEFHKSYTLLYTF